MSTLPYFPTPASPEQMTEGPDAVQLTAAGPARQGRLTVFFRLLMAIPQGIVLGFLAIAALAVAFIGWWAALFTGRLPEFAQTYLTGFIRWLTRVQAYVMLLTDVYPPFSFDDEPGYPVRIAVPPRERLNRLAVFFRVILVIPANLLTTIVSYGGMTIVAFIAWLITLITGRLPNGMHLAYVAIFRYATRTNCYFYLLTPTYPRGLFGDGPAAPAAQGNAPEQPAGDLPASSDLAPPGYPAPAAGWAPPAEPALAGYGTPGGYGTPADHGAPADWRLLLTTGARQLLTLFIVLGAVLYVGDYFATNAISAAISKATETPVDRMNAANATLNTQLTNWESTVQSCSDISCVNTADAQAATDFADFASTLQGTSMPAPAVAPANQLYSDATTIARDLTKLSRVTSAAQYQSTVTSTGIQQALNQFDNDENALGNALNGSS
jgi:hypothetical protein